MLPGYAETVESFHHPECCLSHSCSSTARILPSRLLRHEPGSLGCLQAILDICRTFLLRSHNHDLFVPGIGLVCAPWLPHEISAASRQISGISAKPKTMNILIMDLRVPIGMVSSPWPARGILAPEGVITFGWRPPYRMTPPWAVAQRSKSRRVWQSWMVLCLLLMFPPIGENISRDRNGYFLVAVILEEVQQVVQQFVCLRLWNVVNHDDERNLVAYGSLLPRFSDGGGLRCWGEYFWLKCGQAVQRPVSAPVSIPHGADQKEVFFWVGHAGFPVKNSLSCEGVSGDFADKFLTEGF